MSKKTGPSILHVSTLSLIYYQGDSDPQIGDILVRRIGLCSREEPKNISPFASSSRETTDEMVAIAVCRKLVGLG